MPLSSDRVVEQARILHGYHVAERSPLDTIRRYWKGRQALAAVIPSSAPREVKELARIARVNVCEIVVDTLAQSTFVEGFRGKGDEADSPVWKTWRAKRSVPPPHRIFAITCPYSTYAPSSTRNSSIVQSRGAATSLKVFITSIRPTV